MSGFGYGFSPPTTAGPIGGFGQCSGRSHAVCWPIPGRERDAEIIAWANRLDRVVAMYRSGREISVVFGGDNELEPGVRAALQAMRQAFAPEFSVVEWGYRGWFFMWGHNRTLLWER